MFLQQTSIQMHKKLLESTRRGQEKLKSPAIRQSSSGNKNIKLTNRGLKNEKDSLSKQQKQGKLTIIQPLRVKRSPSKNTRLQVQTNLTNAKQPPVSKQKTKKKIISYKTQQTQYKQQKQEQQSSNKSLDKSLVNIQFEEGVLDDDINLLSISNYQKDNNYENNFLRETHVTNGVSKKTLSKQKQMKKSNRLNKQKILEEMARLKEKQKQLEKLIELNNRKQRLESNSNGKKRLLRKESLSKKFYQNDVVIVAKKTKVQRLNSFNREAQQFQEQTALSLEKSNKNLQASHHKLQKSLKGDLEKSHKKLELSSKKQMEKSNRGIVKSKKGSKKKQSQSNSSKKADSRNSKQKKQVSAIKNENLKKIPSSLKPPKSIPKSSSNKDTKSKSVKKQSSSKLPKAKLSAILKTQESSSDTTNAPTLEQLQKLKQQNEKYKIFLATSAFKVQQLKRQIQQSKQVRETQRSMYNFQLQNLKKQLDSNKRFLGHLYSYEDNNTGNFLPEQIIIETDNESSSVLDSINVLSKVSKPKGSEDNISSQNNKRSSLVESDRQISNSNEKSDSSKQIEDYQKQMNIDSAKLRIMNKGDPNIKDQKQNEKQIARMIAEMKYLKGINKIPSLVMHLSLQESDKGANAGKQASGGGNNNTTKAQTAVSRDKNPLQQKKAKSPQKILQTLKKNEQYIDSNLLLINSKGK